MSAVSCTSRTAGIEDIGGVVLHTLPISQYVPGTDLILEGESIKPLSAGIEGFCRDRLRPNQGLAIDFGAVRFIDVVAAEVLARLVFRFRTGQVGDERNFGKPFYLAFRNLTADGPRRTVSAAFQAYDINPKLIVLAPQTGDPPRGVSVLEHHLIGNVASIQRCQDLFQIIWQSDGPIRVRDMILPGQADEREQTNHRSAYLGVLFDHRLIARPKTGTYVRVR